MTAHDHPGGAVAFEATHRTQPRCEPTMVGLDPIVRVLLGVVKRARDQLADHRTERPSAVAHHLRRLTVSAQRRRTEPSRRPGIASWRDVHVDDLAMLVDRPIEVPPPARDLHIRLVHKPTIADGVPTGPGPVGQQRREPLHPPIHGDVIDLDPSFDQESFDIAIPEPEPQVPAHREDDHLRREPKPRERRTRDCRKWTSMRSAHPATLALARDHHPMQQSPGVDVEVDHVSWYIEGGRRCGIGGWPKKLPWFDKSKALHELDEYPSSLPLPRRAAQCATGQCPSTGASEPTPGTPSPAGFVAVTQVGSRETS
jgi:hypothetical protein